MVNKQAASSAIQPIRQELSQIIILFSFMKRFLFTSIIIQKGINTCLTKFGLLGNSGFSSLSARLVLFQESLGNEDVINSGNSTICSKKTKGLKQKFNCVDGNRIQKQMRQSNYEFSFDPIIFHKRNSNKSSKNDNTNVFNSLSENPSHKSS